jgi:hypothetical protein
MNPGIDGQAPPRKGLPVWLWVIVGLFSLLILVVASVAVGGYYIARQFAKNPRGVVEAIVRHDPNLEIVSDDGTGHITLRDKRRGKNFTINYDDIKGGRIHIEADNGENVVINADGRGVEVRDHDSSAHIGAGSSRVPAWVPAYPGSHPEGAVDAVENGEESGAFHFVTSDDAQKVREYYEDALRQAGFSVRYEDDEIKGDDAAHNRKLGIRSSGALGHTSVTVGFTEKKS